MTDSDEVFHCGERIVQDRAGVGARMAVAGRHAIRDFMTEQHRAFFEQLPFIVVGSVDAEGQPWASVLAGKAGFAYAAGDRTLTVGALPVTGDPLVLEPGRKVGLLGIEPHTRRRNRLNGVVQNVGPAGFSVRVQQSFGNCPKYIHPRKVVSLPSAGGGVVRSSGLDEAAAQMLRSADTFFIASAWPASEDDSRAHGVDVSHRGGSHGFIRVEGGVLKVPDYVGNNYFNTLGNLEVNPRAGLLVIDWEGGGLLFVAVEVQVDWKVGEAEAAAGVRRVLVMRVVGVRRIGSGRSAV